MNAEKKDLGVGVDKKLARWPFLQPLHLSPICICIPTRWEMDFNRSLLVFFFHFLMAISLVQYNITFILFPDHFCFRNLFNIYTCAAAALVMWGIEPSSQTKVRQRRRRRRRPCNQRPSTKSNNRSFPCPASGTNPDRNNSYIFIFSLYFIFSPDIKSVPCRD